MTLDPRHLAKAVEILRKKGLRRDSDVETAVHYIGGFSPFDEMDDEELRAYVEGALAELPGGGRPTRPRPGAAGAGGGGQRRLPQGLEPLSPFRFVTLADEVVQPEDPRPIDIPLKDGFCAEIVYEFEAETPLLVGAEIEQQGSERGAVAPMRFGAAGNYVIPGATVRGLVRSAVEIVAHGRLGIANLHHRFGIRDFEHPYYEDVAKVGRVQAGWLAGEVDGAGTVTAMRIEPCEWAHVLIDSMAGSPEFKGKVSGRQSWIGKNLGDKYAALGMAGGPRRNPVFDFSKTFGFGPKFDDQGRTVRDPQQGGAQGVPVCSGKLPGKGGNKKYEYAFFDLPGAVPVAVTADVIEDFVRLNSKPSKNRPTPDGSWKELKPTFAAGKRIPVFFVGDLATCGREFFFGLTRMLKLPHQRSVGDVLKGQSHHPGKATLRELKNGQQAIDRYDADFVENLFGYVIEPKDVLDDPGNTSPGGVARKGRVAFSFAKLQDGPAAARASPPVVVVQSAPRASFSPFYLKPALPDRKDGEADYSAVRPPRLAGRKRYLPRDAKPDPHGRLAKIEAMGQRQLEAIGRSSGGRDPSADIQSRLRFLVPADAGKPLVFCGEIKLRNVTAAELGAVLFALTHGGDPQKPCRHMIGRAKPFGAGQVRLRSLCLAAEANAGTLVLPPDEDEFLSADTRTGFCPRAAHAEAPKASLKPFLKAFGDFMRRQPGLSAFPDRPAIREFLGASDPEVGAELDEKLEYLPLPSFNQIRKAMKPLKDLNAEAPAKLGGSDGRLLGAPEPKRKPVFWT